MNKRVPGEATMMKHWTKADKNEVPRDPTLDALGLARSIALGGEEWSVSAQEVFDLGVQGVVLRQCEIETLRAELAEARELLDLAARRGSGMNTGSGAWVPLGVAEKFRRERDEARERVAELEGIVNMAIEWFSNIKSSDGSGHEDLGRNLQKRLDRSRSEGGEG